MTGAGGWRRWRGSWRTGFWARGFPRKCPAFPTLHTNGLLGSRPENATFAVTPNVRFPVPLPHEDSKPRTPLT